MKVIFGGLFQGKVDFAINELNVNKDKILSCKELTKETFLEKLNEYDCFTDFEEVITALHDEGIDEHEFLLDHIFDLSSKVIIAQDLSCGIVPIEKSERSRREAISRALNFLCKEANEVYRVFCGIGIKIK